MLTYVQTNLLDNNIILIMISWLWDMNV